MGRAGPQEASLPAVARRGFPRLVRSSERRVTAAGGDSPAAWVVAARAGDLEAFARLVDRFRDPIHHLALAMVGDPHEAADVTQETFIKAHARLGELRDPERVAGWLRSIGRNEAREALRSRARRGRLATVTEPAALDRVATEPGAGPLERREAWDALVRALPDELREVLVLRFSTGLAYREIAELLEISVDLVGVRLHRAKEALRRELGESAESGGDS